MNRRYPRWNGREPHTDRRAGDPARRGSTRSCSRRGRDTQRSSTRRRSSERFPRPSAGRCCSLARAEGRRRRPLNVGVVLSGGQAPGGHNVITGLVRRAEGGPPRLAAATAFWAAPAASSPAAIAS